MRVSPCVVTVYVRTGDYYDTFIANVWDSQSRIVPYKYPALTGLKMLMGMDLAVQLIYLDADLNYERLKIVLDTLFNR